MNQEGIDSYNNLINKAAGSTYGNHFLVTTYRESHGGGVGCVIDGCPPRIPLSEADMQVDLDRRRRKCCVSSKTEWSFTAAQQQGNLTNSFISSQEATFGLPAQSLAKLQVTALGRTTAKAGVSMPLSDQKNLFSFESPRLRFAEGSLHHLSNSKPMNLLHGIPTNMEPKQLVTLHQSTQTLGNFNMRVSIPTAQNNPLLMQMAQSQPRGQMLSENVDSHATRFPSSLVQPTVPNSISNGVLGNRITGSSNITSAYNTVPQNSSLLKY
ncbi:hypothetical protein V8G54_022793 [Vigna mungo]|uniref:chorismate synthase n=1 Tax=Vigna mungo TaxID=3915 RepID=A0AAQ3N3V4_VIGMU